MKLEIGDTSVACCRATDAFASGNVRGCGQREALTLHLAFWVLLQNDGPGCEPSARKHTREHSRVSYSRATAASRRAHARRTASCWCRPCTGSSRPFRSSTGSSLPSGAHPCKAGQHTTQQARERVRGGAARRGAARPAARALVDDGLEGADGVAAEDAAVARVAVDEVLLAQRGQLTALCRSSGNL